MTHRSFLTALLLLVACLSLSTSPSAEAQAPVFTLAPGPHRLGEAVPLQVSMGANSCLELPGDIDVESGGNGVLRVLLRLSDVCIPNLPAQQRSYLLGQFEPGVYQVRFEVCAGLPPPGVEPCAAIDQQTLIVLGAEPAVTLPSASTLGLALLALTLGALGVRGLGRR